MATANTLRETLVFEGVGLHTGEKCKIVLHPDLTSLSSLSVNGGEDDSPSPRAERELGGKAIPTHILLRKGNHTFPARWDYVVDTTRATVLGDGAVRVSTVEHLMAALWMTGITHCVIEVLQGNEIPILDGSAWEFVEAISPHPTASPRLFSAGRSAELGGRTRGEDVQPSLPAPLSVGESEGSSPLLRRRRGTGDEGIFQIRHADRYLALSLSGDTLFGYIQFPEPLGVQAGAFRIQDTLMQIAPARTFGFLREVEALQKQGLALGGALDNALVIDETGYHNPARFEDEPLRHKLLDALGDLYLSGVYLHQFSLVAVKPGHALNVQLARQLAQALNAEDDLWRSSD